jgi:hypothetical protein
MSIYTPPSLSAVNFSLSAHTVPSIASPIQALAAYTVPALAAITFALSAYTVPTYPNVGWELLPGGGGFPTQYSGLRYFAGTVKELCLVAVADAPAGPQWRIDKNGTVYAVYLVDTSDSNASQVRINTPAGIKAARYKT